MKQGRGNHGRLDGGLPPAVYGKSRQPMKRHVGVSHDPGGRDGDGSPESRRKGIFLLLIIIVPAILLIGLVALSDCVQ